MHFFHIYYLYPLSIQSCTVGQNGGNIYEFYRFWCTMQFTSSLTIRLMKSSLHWRHNDHDGVSNQQPHGCLLNRLFRRRSKKTSKLRVTGLCVGNSPGPVNSPHKGPVTRKIFTFDDVIMVFRLCKYVNTAVFWPFWLWWHHFDQKCI